jgi:phage shock protein PspC (stress-responsive transcriptional regulator)
MISKIREFLELHAFGVCSAIGDKLGIASSRIRMWFIYISFLTLGSPVVVYMVLAFWMNIKKTLMLTVGFLTAHGTLLSEMGILRHKVAI